MVPSPAQKYGLLLAFLISSILVTATVDLLVSQIGPKRSASDSKVIIGPIRETKKSTILATGIEKLRKLG